MCGSPSRARRGVHNGPCGFVNISPIYRPIETYRSTLGTLPVMDEIGLKIRPGGGGALPYLSPV